VIRTEKVIIDEVEFIRTYSDENRYVVRDGESYEEAMDPTMYQRSYTEGDLIEIYEQPEKRFDDKTVLGKGEK